MKNSKIKLFLENFLFYGILSILHKVLPFVTLPLITKLLPDSSSYGIADMFNLIVSFGSAVGILGIYDAMFREYFEDKEDKLYSKRVISTGLNIVLVSSTVIFILFFILINLFAIYFHLLKRFKKSIYNLKLSLSFYFSHFLLMNSSTIFYFCQ